MADGPAMHDGELGGQDAVGQAQHRVLSHYIDRLSRGVTRSAVLKAFPTRTVKRIDLARFSIASPAADPAIPDAMVQALVRPEGSYRLRFGGFGLRDQQGEESRRLFTTLRTTLMRDAAAVHRETGLWALWLAYPLLYVPNPQPDALEHILAPLFLFPITIESAGLPEGHLVLKRRPGTPRFNRIAAHWIRRNLEFDPPEPTGTDLLGFDGLDALRQHVSACCSQFSPPVDSRLGPSVQPVPEPATAAGWAVPRLLDSGIVGLIQWENMELLGDLEKLKERLQGAPDLTSPAADFLRHREHAPEPNRQPPGEADRYLVTATDHFQEEAVWKARRPEGVVVHGPPGTGKSQVIVNIVADTVAHGHRVLVVCQKKAALDVVSSRLRAAGLGDLVCQVDDAEADRKTTIEALRNAQRPHDFTEGERGQRAARAEEIERIEKRFEDYAKALFHARDRYGLNYQTVLARIGRIEREDPLAQPLPELREVLRNADARKLTPLCQSLTDLQSVWGEAGLPRNPWLKQGGADLTGDGYQRQQIGKHLDDALSAGRRLDRLTGPARGTLTGHLEVIRDAARSLATAWPPLSTELGAKPGGKPITEIDADTFKRCGEATQAWRKVRGSVFRWLQPSFHRAKRTARAFAGERPWTLNLTAAGVLSEIGQRGADVLCVLESTRKWLNAPSRGTLEAAMRSGGLVGKHFQKLKDYLGRLEAVARYRAMLRYLVQQHGDMGKHAVGAITGALEAADTHPEDAQPPGIGDWRRVAELSALLEWAAQIERDFPILRAWPPESQQVDRARLADLASSKRAIEPSAILGAWAARWDRVDHAWRNGLQIVGRGSRRLREVVNDGRAHGLFDLKPCWLANPGTVSQIFPLEPGLFDLVVFDEASQCPPEYALPALHRGQRVVVAGDGKQLPPTMFFTPQFVLDDDGQDDGPTTLPVAIAAGAEDLLSLAQARLPEAHLNVHYRSLDPVLIQFSNAAFYRNRLEVPHPPRRVLHDGSPALVLEHLDNAAYTASRTNPEEARRIVGHLKHLWLEAQEAPTVGVITFNEPQKVAIQDLLEAECRQDAQFRAAYDHQLARVEDGKDVGFFVKSLEAVQGDERDAILFSTTYGRREDGTFSRAFLGPLTQSGGERRLNVAITRARRWVKIVSSLPILELANALAPGVVDTPDTLGRAMLQLYLKHAEHVSGGDERAAGDVLRRASEVAGAGGQHPGTTGDEESEFECEVRACLQAAEIQIDSQVGSGAFRIDLGVRHPQGGYILGIECDGKAYHSSLSARAHDVWRQEILEERGWNIHRIWSTSWRSDRAREIARVEERLGQLLREDLNCRA